MTTDTQPASWDHQMGRVSSEENPTGSITIGQQEVLFPFANVQHFIVNRLANYLFKLRRDLVPFYSAIDRRS
jgi:hypothetical protein